MLFQEQDRLLKLVEAQEKRIKALELRVPCRLKEQRQLAAHARKHVGVILEKATDQVNVSERKRHINLLWKDYRVEKQVDSYKETPAVHFVEALHWIDRWTPVKSIRLPAPPCLLCEESPGTLEPEEGNFICDNCAQVMGLLK